MTYYTQLWAQWADSEIKRLRTKVAQLEQWKAAVDDALVVAHVGTTDSFESPRHAVNALCSWSESVGEYFAKEAQPAPTDEQMKRVRIAIWGAMADGVGPSWKWFEERIRTALQGEKDDG